MSNRNDSKKPHPHPESDDTEVIQAYEEVLDREADQVSDMRIKEVAARREMVGNVYSNLPEPVTLQARDILHRLAPEALGRFLEANRDYVGVDGALGSQGVVPDIYRKTMKLKSAMWDGVQLRRESPRQIAMELVGNLLLMVHYMDVEQSQDNPLDQRSTT